MKLLMGRQWSYRSDYDGYDTYYEILFDGEVQNNTYEKEEAEREVESRNNCEHYMLEPPYWGTGNPRPIVIECMLCHREVKFVLDDSRMEWS